jgi:hypothetical protein
MTEPAEFMVRAVLIGTGATAVMDLWAAARKWLRGRRPGQDPSVIRSARVSVWRTVARGHRPPGDYRRDRRCRYAVQDADGDPTLRSV